LNPLNPTTLLIVHPCRLSVRWQLVFPISAVSPARDRGETEKKKREGEGETGREREREREREESGLLIFYIFFH
jgi:hypothetical protein